MKLLICSLLMAIASAMHRSEHFTPAHGYHVHHFEVTGTSPPPIGYANAMNASVDIVIKAGEVTITLDLRLKTIQWGKGAKIITEFGADGKPSKTLELFHRGYTGSAFVAREGSNDFERGDASVTFFQDGRATMLVITNHDVYHVDLNEFGDRQMPLKGRDKGHRLHMTRVSDILLNEASADERQRNPLKWRIRNFLKARPGGRHLDQLIPFDNCFTGQSTSQRAIRMGLVADPAYYGLKSNPSSTSVTYNTANDQMVINAMIAELNKASDMVYSRQLRVWLLPGETIIGTAAASLPMSQGSSPKGTGRTSACSQTDGSARLTALRTWRQSYYNAQQDSHALWHLLTDCHPPPGTVGIAYIGVICSKSYGVGWTNNVYSSTWLTFAHEVGHNFNSPHSFDNGQGKTGGIMDYGDGYYPAPVNRQKAPGAEFAFNPLRKNDICGGITQSLTSTGSWNIAPNVCWTVYNNAPQPVPTPKPTARPITPSKQPSRHPTPKPTTPQPTGPIPTPKPTGNPVQPTNRPITTTTTTMRPTPRPSRDPTTRRPTPRPTTLSPTNVNTPRPTMTRPIITFVWIRDGNNYGPCTPSCVDPTKGQTSQKMPLYACEEQTVYPPSATIYKKIVVDSKCDPLLKPIGDPATCTVPNCGSTCGDGTVSGLEKCDPGSNSCCLKDCTGFKQTYGCLKHNNVVDASFMTCLNDVQHSNCYLYLFQGEYFNKFYAVPGYRSYYVPEWPGARKHKGIVQDTWTAVTAIAGGRNGQIWVFNKFNYQQIDYSDELKGNVLKTGNLITDFTVAPKFAQCTSGVTAADIYYQRWLLVFCETMYTWVNIVTNQGVSCVYPADRLFYNGLGNGMGVNAFFFDPRTNYFQIFRGMIQQSFLAAGFAVGSSNVTTPSVFGTGSQPQLGNATCFDPECASCTSATVCTQCFAGYKALGGRCIAQKIVVDMKFSQGSAIDAIYSQDPVLTSTSTQWVPDQGNVANGAMRFNGQTKVSASAPGLNGKVIKDFRIEVFFKPATSSRQTLLTVDSRFQVDFTNYDASTMKLWARFDQMTFDCYVPKPLTLNQWNQVAVEFSGRQIITYVNGFTHNRGYQAIAGGPGLGLSFQNVTIGAAVNGINGDLSSFVIQEVPVTFQPAAAAAENKNAQAGWVLPVAIVGAVLGCCLCAGLIFLCYSRGLCGDTDAKKGDDAQTMFMAASQQNQVQTNYVAMTDS